MSRVSLIGLVLIALVVIVGAARAEDAAGRDAMVGFFRVEAPAVEKSKIRKLTEMPDLRGRGVGTMRASWYGGGERLSRYTASGAPFRPMALTAAHRSLPFGTRLLVSHAGRSAVVVVNDRGPAAWTGRSLDLSRGAARAIGIERAGSAAVRVARL